MQKLFILVQTNPEVHSAVYKVRHPASVAVAIPENVRDNLTADNEASNIHPELSISYLATSWICNCICMLQIITASGKPARIADIFRDK